MDEMSLEREMESTSAKNGHLVDPNKQPERIRIPKFWEDKIKYSTLWAAFSSCVDETSLSKQFEMLRLESCLEGEAAVTVRGLSYSSKAATARLNQKYGAKKLETYKCREPSRVGKICRPSAKDSCYLKGK